ncbi:MAG: metal-sensitive transcriptional regulator [Eubacteriales bacterium]|nr:metal-sensitive transcriptional regulator [Eubacteriales bacterium]
MDTERSLLNRMKRIEGQVKGIEKMIEKGEYCGDILIQISAVRSALNKVGGVIIENYAKNCIVEKLNNIDSEDALDELLEIILKYNK